MTAARSRMTHRPADLVIDLRANRIDQDSDLFGEALRCYGDVRHESQTGFYRRQFERRMRRERLRRFHRSTLGVILRALFHLSWIAGFYQVSTALLGR